MLSSFFSTSCQQGANTSSIRITLGGEKAPYATAYEWGSGIHATRGDVGVYPLAARPGTKNLVFWWENRGKLFVGPALPIGHPGVAPKPYIRPSIDENMAEMKKIMAQEFKIAILAGTEKVEVINDLVANAYGISVLKKSDFEILNMGKTKKGNQALISAGTGLGEAILFWDGQRHVPSPSEGGHAEFGPRNHLEMELLRRT